MSNDLKPDESLLMIDGKKIKTKTADDSVEKAYLKFHSQKQELEKSEEILTSINADFARLQS